MSCKTCGGTMVGDGYTSVCHCENLDVLSMGLEPDAGPVYCCEDPCPVCESDLTFRKTEKGVVILECTVCGFFHNTERRLK